ncbi:MAG: PilC/PilY family type IV pilus protein [Gallionellaceae bacterium]|nr:PilC/PilY family type IV pilus protein [Gallionellaceae bacterium]
MCTFYRSKLLTLIVCCAALFAPLHTSAEDIDIFTGASAGTAANPHILFVLDNTSNWSRQSQKWPGGLTQGQAEAQAIKDVINSLTTTDINMGLMEYATGSGGPGGFIRYAIRPMSGVNITNFSTELDEIYNNIGASDEKTNGSPYGPLMYDAYNYFAGASSIAPGAVLASKADSGGYTTTYSRYKSPLSSENSCARAFIIFIGNPSSSGPDADDAANTTAMSGVGGNTTQLPLPYLTTSDVTTTTVLGNTMQCYASPPSSAVGAAGYETQCAGYTNGCVIGNAVASTAPVDCASGTLSYSVIGTQTGVAAGTVSHAITSSTAGSGSNWTIGMSSHRYTSGTSVTISGCAVSGGKTLNGTYTISSPTANSFVISKSGNPPTCGSDGSVSGTEPAIASSTTNLGYTAQCYSSSAAGTCFTTDYAACSNGTYSGGCACGTPTASTTPGCASGYSKYEVKGKDVISTLMASSSTFADTAPRNADEWSRFLFNNGVPVASGVTATSKFISTYTIDVYNAQPNAVHTALLMNMAKYSGGKYFAATNSAAIVNAIKKIVAEIQSVNTTFASASLPVSSTNRSQNANQVFIGMFQTDPEAKPRWFGNLKQYQIGLDNGVPGLQDVVNEPVVNNVTGFLGDCTVSFWTTESRTEYSASKPWASTFYWENITGVVPSPSGKCTTPIVDTRVSPNTNFVHNIFSDMPDGALVQKGAVAEVLRKGNNPPATDTTPTWAVNRTLYTVAPTPAGLVALSTNPAGMDSDTLSFTQGYDFNNETNLYAQSSVTRASIHGDIIHSRPLAINYGTLAASTVGVTAFYGSNDGTLRAVSTSGTSAGKELWAFIAPEFSSTSASRNPTSSSNPLERLRLNNPLVNYPVSPALTGTPSPIPRDYFFDGTIGAYQNSDNTQVWIYPTMRRGGRMIYALDVTNSSPTSTATTKVAYKWRVGCPNLTNDTGCTTSASGTSMSGIGQTWSTPIVSIIKGYSATAPSIVIGGGYDNCEDTDSSTTTCTSSSKGKVVYVLDADTGDVIRSFSTVRSVAADISLIDTNADGSTDYAFVADTGGNIYRISFVTSGGVAAASADWTIKRVAYTNGAGRKFMYPPTLLASKGKVYLAIASGDRERPLSTNYPYTTPVINRLYVYEDDLARGDAVGATVDTAINLDGSSMSNFTTDGGCAQAAFTSISGKVGWYMDFPNRGEQGVTSAVIVGTLVAMSTNQAVVASNTCTTNLGIARGYWVNLLNGSGAIGVAENARCGGTRSSEFTGGGLPPSPVIVTVQIGDETVTGCIGCIGLKKPDDPPCTSILCFPEPPITVNSTRKSLYWKNNLDN